MMDKIEVGYTKVDRPKLLEGVEFVTTGTGYFYDPDGVRATVETHQLVQALADYERAANVAEAYITRGVNWIDCDDTLCGLCDAMRIIAKVRKECGHE